MKSILDFINENRIYIPKYLFHKSSYLIRNKILNEGLKANIGASTFIHSGHKNLQSGVFLFDANKEVYDSTYDDDIWVIDTSKLDKSKFIKDYDEYMYETFGSVVYTEDISKSNIKLIYKGSKKDSNVKSLNNELEFIKKILKLN